MRIAVLSDSHDHLGKLALAVQAAAERAEALLFCGDFCAPFSLQQIAEGFPGPIHAVFGNNDGDRFLLARVASGFPNVTLHGEVAKLELGGLRVALNHYPEIAEDLAASGRYDAVFYGHNHRHKIERLGDCDLVNPGEIMGRYGRSTFVVYDTVTRVVETVEV
jgi:uncharacterized protein